MSKELENVQRKIERLEKLTKSKAHGKELKLVQELSVLYRKRKELQG